MSERPLQSINAIAAASIAVGAVVVVLKGLAWWLTGSVALYSDALESLVNIATALAALVAIRYGALPPDANHPYGHQKAEYFAVVLEGVLIVIAAISILSAALAGYRDPRALAMPVEGLSVTVAATIVNGAWCAVLLRVGRRRRSPALIGEGAHLFTDVLTSAGVVVGLVLSLATGWLILDPLIAALVALMILWQGWRIARLSIGGLMDEAVSPETLDRIRQVIKANSEGAIEAHDLLTRVAGRVTFIEFHLVVPGAMPVSRSHDICDRIERALRAAVAGAHITIHVEPEAKAKHEDAAVVV